MREHFTDLCQFELIFDFYVYDFVRYLMVWNFRCLSSSLCKIMYVSRRPECNFKVEQTQNFFFRQSLFGGFFFGVLHHHEKQTFGKRLEIFSVLVAANWNKLHQRRPTSDWRFRTLLEDFSPQPTWNPMRSFILHFFTNSVSRRFYPTTFVWRKIFA